jgi:aminoglycoside 6'-N-acetyltransferase I
MIRVRAVTPADAAAWLRKRHALWPDDADSHRADIDRFFAGDRHEPLEALIATDDAGAAVGFAELSIRNIAEDCTTDRVAYLEGWYVDPHMRRRGVGAALIRASEAWGRAQGCAEFGSDTLIDNAESAAAHRALGFTETAQLRTFLKRL